MVDVKQAILNAKTYAGNLLGVSDLLLEEVRSSNDQFQVTFSFPARGQVHLNALTAGWDRNREYKKFSVDKKSGEVLGMSIRKIA
jgi:hypothetical protein